MRLDAVIAAPVAGLGLSAILLEPEVAAAFSLSGSGCPSAAPSRSARRNICLVSRRPHCPPQNRSRSQHQSNNVSIPHTRLSESVRKGGGDYVDAVVEGKTAGLALEGEGPENTSAKERKRDILKSFFRDLASLSLVDYKWRSALFKKQEADRMEEEWMAAMMGEDPAYARPMDADEQKRGPLGNAERSAVKWLTAVIEEEGRRARRIAESDGELVRPMDIPSEEAGPLSELEKRAIQFLSDITDAEVERVRSGTIRPKDSERPGPLGEAEARAMLALNRIVESEKFRGEQTRMRGGDAVRPIDVPDSPLGEFERYVGDIIRAERQRVKDRDANDGRLVRPKDASIKSGLSEVERKAADDWELLRKEESERLFSLRRFLDERRPMETDKDSALGVTETFMVGLLRGPQLVMKTVDRVKELLSSDGVAERDEEILKQQRSLPESSGGDSELKDESTEKRKSTGPSSEEDGLTA